MPEFYRFALLVSAVLFGGSLFKVLTSRKLDRVEWVWTSVPGVLIAGLALGFKFLN